MASKILTPAELVRDPFALFARIVQIQHGGDSVHAQPVDMIFLEPEQRRGNQETAHLIAAEIENRRVPFRMKSLARIRVLIKMSAVEIHQSVLIGWKMRRHPVENDADSAGMQMVDEIHQILRRAVACRRREISRGLIAPRTIERVLGDRHEFDMRKSGLLEIGGQLVRQLAIVEKVAVLAAPGTDVQFIDGHGRSQTVSCGAR